MTEQTPALQMNYDIVISAGSVEFVGYEQMKESAQKLADHVKTVQVTEDTVKDSKRLLASINKEMKAINDRRIQAKRELLEPYELLEDQTKEIDSIVKEASKTVKDQISQLEEAERDQKEEAIRELFEKRIKPYKLGDIVEADDFLKPQHLNKTASMNKIEGDMVEWIVQTVNDVKVIRGLEHSEDVLVEYKQTLNLSQAMNTVQHRKDQQRKAQEALEKSKSKKEKQRDTEQKKTEQTALFKVTGEKNIKHVELLLKDSGIDFEKLDA